MHDEGASIAISAACTIDEYQDGTYECSRQGSQFSTSGSVMRSPAGALPRQCATQYASPTLTITVA